MDGNEWREKLQKERDQYYLEVKNSRWTDETFARPDDEPLTAEETAAIDAYWGRYSFAYPEIDYKSFRTFKNRCGRFDVRHCPEAVRKVIFKRFFFNRDYAFACQNKGLMDYLYPDLKKPRTFLRRLDGWFYDETFRPVSREEAVRACCEHVRAKGDLIVKCSGISGGHGIAFLTAKNAEPGHVGELLDGGFAGSSLVIQEVLTQSPFMAAFNASSVNTVRISTLLFKGEVTPLAALIRVGGAGSGVDNWCSGGSLVGIDMATGRCLSWALANDRTHLSRLPSGLDLAEKPLCVPSFDKLREQVTRAHYRMPYIKLISWDIAIDEADEPVFIECNFGGMIQIHEAVTGPVFGPLMDQLCEEYLLKRFFLRFAEGGFVCKEYHDRVEVERYTGPGGAVTVPDRLRDKPVTRIEPGAFKDCRVEKLTASRAVLDASPSAAAGVGIHR